MNAIEGSRASSARVAVSDLDRFLGDPRKPGHPFSYRDIVQNEEDGALPPGAVEKAQEWGFQKFLVPAELGGRLHTLEELFLVTRAISRRNLTVAVMFGSALLGANPVWLWGTSEQKENLSKEVLNGELTCFGVSEADHGSDVLASETVARLEGNDLVLTGTKWPVGNATRARFITTFARMGDENKFSLILVDKEQLDTSSWHNQPYVKTVGLRGHDLSGIVFKEARLPASAVIGREGIGLVQTLKALQITRTAIAALSVGTMDATVRIALTYAHDRKLYGNPIYALPAIQDHLIKAHLDLLISECVAVPVTRALSYAPGRMSLWSSVVKYFVPVTAEGVVADMATVLGARGYLSEGVADGIFQKLQRDHAIASIFEGTTHVNLHVVADQLPFVLARANEQGSAEARDELLAGLFSLSEGAPTWQPNGSWLQLTNEGRDEITHSWETITQHLDELAAAPDAPGTITPLRKIVDEIYTWRRRTYGAITAAEEYDSNSTQALRLAGEHCLYHAAASCLLTWFHNRHTLGGSFAEGGWLVLCLERLLQRLNPQQEFSTEYVPAVESVFLRNLKEDSLFSILSLAAE